MAIQSLTTVTLFALFGMALLFKMDDWEYWVGIVGISIIVNPALKYWVRYFSGYEPEDE
jgi:hypothetical protein